MAEGQPLASSTTGSNRARRRAPSSSRTFAIINALVGLIFLAARQGRAGLQISNFSNIYESYLPTDLALSLGVSNSISPIPIELAAAESTATATAFNIQRKPFDSFFVNSSNVEKYQQLKDDADADGMMLDFAVIGYPKCGTTTMIANLGNLAPVPAEDICTPLFKTVWYAYHNWPKVHGEEKLMRGVKCPMIIDSNGVGPPILKDFSRHLPRTRLIVGIRHPVLWYQSFYNMQARNRGIAPADSTDYTEGGRGRGWCKPRKLFCLNRARFHLMLAQLGKTPLNDAERELLPPELKISGKIRNPIFLYDTEQLADENIARKELLWSDLATFIGYPRMIPHDKYYSSHGRSNAISRTVNICDERYDPIRSTLLQHGHQMSQWICPYFVNNGTDVYVSSQDHLCELVEKYGHDPCGRLTRTRNGTYVVDLNSTLRRRR